MQRIKLSDARPGMTLAQPLTLDGLVLCGEGTELTAKVISRLARREVEFVVVEGEPVESGPEQAARIAQARQAIDHRFRRLTGDGFMMGIKAVFERQLGLVQPQEDSPPQ